MAPGAGGSPRGSGTTPQEVNQLLNQFKQAKGIMKDLASGKVPGMPGTRTPLARR